MADVGIRELKQHLSAYLDRAERGELIRVTDRGRPKVLLGPLPGRGAVEAGVAEGWITPGSGEGLRNVRTVKGITTDPRLPRQSVEAALIVDAYHEFGNPVAMLRGIAAALKPGGSLGVVNFNKSGGGPGPPTDERVDATRVIDEARAAGLTLRRRETFLPFQYFLVFVRADDPSGGGTTAQTR